MLILCRKLGEDILIGDDVVVKVTEIGGGHVRLGITAPEDVGIFRRELIEPDYLANEPAPRPRRGGRRRRRLARRAEA